MSPRVYRREDGRTVRVVPGLWGSNVWIAAYVSPSGGSHRIKSKHLPPCQSAEEMQRLLDQYAASKGWAQQ